MKITLDKTRIYPYNRYVYGVAERISIFPPIAYKNLKIIAKM
jgi:hypothetical protein